MRLWLPRSSVLSLPDSSTSCRYYFGCSALIWVYWTVPLTCACTIMTKFRKPLLYHWILYYRVPIHEISRLQKVAPSMRNNKKVQLFFLFIKTYIVFSIKFKCQGQFCFNVESYPNRWGYLLYQWGKTNVFFLEKSTEIEQRDE